MAVTDKLTLLVSSAGRRVELIECFRSDARRLGIALRVIATDEAPDLSAACQLADLAVAMPRCTDGSFIGELWALCEREHVSLVIPTIDTELPVLAANREAFSRQGMRIAVSSAQLVDIARDKLRTSEVLSASGIRVPRTASMVEILADATDWSWPLVLKPRAGSSSLGVHFVDSLEQMCTLGVRPEEYVAQELWRGKEYTVNLFFDHGGLLRAAVPHWRIETRGGEVSKGRTERLPVLMGIAGNIAHALPGARGALCFQAIVDAAGRAAVFEINARFGGGYPLAHRAGARFSQWLLEESVGLPSSADDDWKNGITMLRYDAAVFLND